MDKKNEQFKDFADKFNGILTELKELSNSFPILHAININIAVKTSDENEETGWNCHSIGIVSDKFNVKLDNGMTPNDNAIVANFIGLLKDPNASHYVASALKYVTAEAASAIREKQETENNGKEAEVVELKK